ncbi:alpha-2C adrenergic receptor-like [Saccostrea cucullata]|uniref:alpha-2C adrenergic receptor-like n=1 Tax=Saccostrea cuccullata TaxID=36930 RepID=UPI002ED23522
MVTNDVMCHGMEVVRHSSVAFSNLILILIAVERLLRVWKPTKNYVSTKMKTFFILAVLMISVICSVPAALIMEVTPHSNNAAKNETNQPKVFNNLSTDTLEPFCGYTTTTLGDNGSKIYRDFLSTMISAELLLLIIIYVIVYVILYTLNEERFRRSASDSSGQPSENSQKPKERQEILYIKTNGDSIETYSSKPGTYLQPNTAEGSTAHSRTESPVEGVTSSEEDGLQVRQTRKNKVQKRKKKLRFSKSTSYVQTKTWTTMMFVCTFINLICWIPFFFAIFNIYDSLVFRYFFFLGYATNPIVYSVVNQKIGQGIADILKKFNICL